MRVPLPDTLSLLSRTPAVFDALLRNAPDLWTNHDEGANTWSPSEIVSHLVYAEQINWMPRARMIREFGTSAPFPAFDRLGRQEENKDKSLATLLLDFAQLRAQSLEELHAWHLTDDDLSMGGLHPALGPVNLAELLSAWAVHDLTHLHQTSRVIAHQFRTSVGPWQQYLGVLHCQGHGG